MNDDFILQRNLDWSTFYRGFAVSVAMQDIFSLHLSAGTLTHGEKREIKIILAGETFPVILSSVNFNRGRYPEHRDMWQITYGKNSGIAQMLRKIFAHTFEILERQRQDKNFLPPNDTKEYFVLYATDLKDTFLMEPIFNGNIAKAEFVQEETSLENLLELPTLTDSEAAIVEKYRLTKIRKLNRSIGNYLKKLYDFRCQLCGENIGEIYGAKIAECHHINYFVQSLNNDASNLLIVCPNHHRIIHAVNPTFDTDRKIYLFPNGYEQTLKLNFHL
ncbi:MAG: hypothetical protein K6G55_00075 [Selenomonadaceae bacterium]|nr:hypothetical protein [Selenomonadaceae bacterium]